MWIFGIKSVMDKEIIIIDAFITNKVNEDKLSKFIDKIKETNLPILLVSNTTIEKYILDKVNYYIYDSNNRLFDDVFEEYENFILWNIIGDIKFNTVHKHKQKHGLSVMVNLFNTLNYIESLGFKYFHRIEYDTILGDKTIEKIKNIKDNILNEKFKGYFILNHNKKTHGFQYFFSEINEFYKIVPKIKNQSDYIDIIKKYYNTNKFVTVEQLMYLLLKDNNNLKFGLNDFDDSVWNTVNSDVHLEKEDKNCITNIYKGTGRYIVMSKNNKEVRTNRVIKIYKNNALTLKLQHDLKGINAYTYNFIENNFDRVDVVENNDIIKTIEKDKESNFFEKV